MNELNRKLQRADEIKHSSGFSPITQIRQEGNLPDLSRHNHMDISRLFLRKNQNQEFLSFNHETLDEKRNYLSTLFKPRGEKKKIETHCETLSQDNDCAICMDKPKNSVLRPCNHMVTCVGCSNLLLNRQDNCPVCRVKIIEVRRNCDYQK